MKFLFDLLPILLFFIAFKIAGIYVATGVAIAASVAQVAWMALTRRKVDPMLWMSLAIVSVCGGATLLLHNETFIKWKPTALYWAFTVGLLVAQSGFGKNPIEAMMSPQITLPRRIWKILNLAWASFFMLLGGLNLVVAYYFSTNAWVNFKLFGSIVCMLVFVVAQGLWLTRYVNQEDASEQR